MSRWKCGIRRYKAAALFITHLLEEGLKLLNILSSPFAFGFLRTFGIAANLGIRLLEELCVGDCVTSH